MNEIVEGYQRIYKYYLAKNDFKSAKLIFESFIIYCKTRRLYLC